MSEANGALVEAWIAQRVEAWHNGAGTPGVGVAEFLGWSDAAYAKWVQDGSLPPMFAALRSADTEGLLREARARVLGDWPDDTWASEKDFLARIDAHLPPAASAAPSTSPVADDAGQQGGV